MTAVVSHREFIPGTTGWSVDDLNDPAVEALWVAGRYEIVEGVLTTMPAAYCEGGFALMRLVKLIDKYLEVHDPEGEVVPEVDVVLGERRVAVVDAIYLSPDDRTRAKQANAERGRRKLKYGRILIPPTLIIESLSLGHESHDREIKRPLVRGGTRSQLLASGRAAAIAGMPETGRHESSRRCRRRSGRRAVPSAIPRFESAFESVVGAMNLLAANFGLSAPGSELTPADWGALAAVMPEPSAMSFVGGGGPGHVWKARSERERVFESPNC